MKAWTAAPVVVALKEKPVRASIFNGPLSKACVSPAALEVLVEEIVPFGSSMSKTGLPRNYGTVASV